MDNKDRLLIMGHRMADIDAFGAAVGIYRIAMSMNKKANIVLNDVTSSVRPMMERFQNNPEYPDDMFLKGAKAAELVDAGTMLVVVDVNRPSITDEPNLLHLIRTIVVLDHHRTSSEVIDNAVLSYVEPYASSACEMVAEVLQYIADGIKVRPCEADAMYAGIVIDTQNFTNAKGGAQVILVSGYDGGTGAAPRTSIKHAGLPWELGIAETHQTLILNGLRTRVRIESDSKLLSGRDVAISCMLGAEEFGFGTTLLMAEGCVMMRVCNLDTCPMGICTQNPELRKNFKGKPEYIINYLTFVAEELREYMAKLGVHTIDELVGRTDLLKVKPAAPGSRASKMDLDCILHNPAIENSNVHFVKEDTYDFHLENTLDMKVLMKKFKLSSKNAQSVTLDVSNTDRAFGAIFGSEITRKYGNSLPDDIYTAHCVGAGGQSFGAFIPNGLTLDLVGDCNDYMGKGLSGGKIVVRPPKGITFKPEENIITGNVALYGATSGKAFISGVAGERFAVRNSGATAVVEGVGDHGCEYMTGGTVVVLGQTGKNFAAGINGRQDPAHDRIHVQRYRCPQAEV